MSVPSVGVIDCRDLWWFMVVFLLFWVGRYSLWGNAYNPKHREVLLLADAEAILSFI